MNRNRNHLSFKQICKLNKTELGICSVGVKTGKTDTEDTDGETTEAPISPVLQCISVSVTSVLSKLTLHIPKQNR